MTMWVKISQAIRHDDAAAVAKFLAQEPEVATQSNDHDETLLHFAAKGGNPQIIAELLGMGARPDQPDFYAWTPLHEASDRGYEEAVALFLETKPKPKINLTTKKDHDSPLYLAASKGHAGVVELLVNAGANPEIRNQEGNTPLHMAVKCGSIKVMEILLDHGADINGKNFMGETPLHVAAHLGLIELATRCLTYGADPEEQDRLGHSFIDTAVRAGHGAFIAHFAKQTLHPPAAGASPADPAQPHPTTAPPALRKTVVMQVQDLATEAMGPNLLRTFLFGPPHGKRHLALKLLDAGLWFFVFPLLLYILWAGFHLQIIPGIVTLSGAERGDSMLLLTQTILNLLIVFTISHWLVASDTDEVPFQHFFVYLRRSIFTRVIQFTLIDVFFFSRFTYDGSFWSTAFLFWMMFLVLYTISFAFYWIDRKG